MRCAWLVGSVLWSWVCWSGLALGASHAPSDVEEKVAEGDLDAEDLIARGARTGGGGRASTYVGLVGFTRSSKVATRELGAMLVVGIPFDAAAARTPAHGSVPDAEGANRESSDAKGRAGVAVTRTGVTGPPTRVCDARRDAPPTEGVAPAGSPSPARAEVAAPTVETGSGRPVVMAPPPAPVAVAAAPVPRVLLAAAPRDDAFALSPTLARAVVAAAWRAAGLDVGASALDATLTRARLAAVLPEARLRAVRSTDQSLRVDALPDEHRTSDAVGANLYLEARLTWRLDRLLYADDEPQLERIRSERQDARARLAARTVELLVRWQRALEDIRAAVPGTLEAREAELHALEATVGLDVLTEGAFAHGVSN